MEVHSSATFLHGPKASSEIAAVIKLMLEERELSLKEAQTGQLTGQETQRLQTIQKANGSISPRKTDGFYVATGVVSVSD